MFLLIQFRPRDFLMFTLILSDHYLPVKAIPTFSPWLTGLQDGPRLFLCPPSPQSYVSVLLSQQGSPVSEFQQFSHQTKVLNSHLQFGLESVEQFHRSLKSSLRARLAGSDWFYHLPLVLMDLRATQKEDTGLSESKAVYGSPLTLPGELVDVPEMPPATFMRKVVLPFLHRIMFIQFLLLSSLQPFCSCYSDPLPSPAKNSGRHKRVRFQVGSQVSPPPVPVRRNPYWSSTDRRICSAISPPLLLGGLMNVDFSPRQLVHQGGSFRTQDIFHRTK